MNIEINRRLEMKNRGGHNMKLGVSWWMGTEQVRIGAGLCGCVTGAIKAERAQ